MSYWLNDPELFLYAKGTGPDDVHLWRFKTPVSTSSLVVPMKPDDFDYVSNVKDHMELIGDTFDWDETDYKRLVKYIFERRLLVNRRGFVIVEVHKADKDGNKMMDEDANKEVPAIYIRSLDVLPLKPYIPNLRERPIPSRTVKYLEDVNGRAAVMEEDNSNSSSTDDHNNKLQALAKIIVDLELKNKTLEDKLTNTKEVWMNDLTNSEWVGVEGLGDGSTTYDNLILLGGLSTFTVDVSSTNVRARYWYKIKVFADGHDLKAVCLEDLTPNKEKARFSQNIWYSFKSKGKSYVFSPTNST